MSDFNEPFTLALIFVGTGIGAKFASRRDRDPSPKINDLSVSTTICLMTLSKIASDTFSAAHNVNVAWSIGLGALLWSIVWDRFFSWIVGSRPPKKKLWLGIIIPDIVAVGALFLYFVFR
jgi:hypothetical protein